MYLIADQAENIPSLRSDGGSEFLTICHGAGVEVWL